MWFHSVRMSWSLTPWDCKCKQSNDILSGLLAPRSTIGVRSVRSYGNLSVKKCPGYWNRNFHSGRPSDPLTFSLEKVRYVDKKETLFVLWLLFSLLSSPDFDIIPIFACLERLYNYLKWDSLTLDDVLIRSDMSKGDMIMEHGWKCFFNINTTTYSVRIIIYSSSILLHLIVWIKTPYLTNQNKKPINYN